MDQPTDFGATLVDGGVFFRVWAPHATSVSVVGTFNDWKAESNPLSSEDGGNWAGFVSGAAAGDEYRFHLSTPEGELLRVDPYAKQVTNSVGNGVVVDSAFDWGDDQPVLPAWNTLAIYELHIGTFHDRKPENNRPATFTDAARRFSHLKQLGVNAIEVMPIAEFPGDFSWGYNPSHPFAVETAYGGPNGFKEFVRAAHTAGLAVILDVVYNHFGPSDLDLWRFDGWRENDLGGIYFYNDHRSRTPWGDTRPDYGRGEVRRYILDNVRMWFSEYRIDGMRFDATSFIRSVEGTHGDDLPDGWSLLQAINEQVQRDFPGRITIAEDLQSNDWLTKGVGAGGAGFGSQWDARFVHPVRAALTAPSDESRRMEDVSNALQAKYNDDAFQRVVYTESHDEVANGKSRVPSEIDQSDPHGWWAQKRSTLGAAMVFTAPGIPMIFQGQEFLEQGWFQDTTPVDWDLQKEFRGIVRLYRDLIRLRTAGAGGSAGLSGQFVHVFHCNDADGMLAFRRWRADGGDVVVVANFRRDGRDGYRVGFPSDGEWKLLFNGDSNLYGEAFTNHPAADVNAAPEPYDGLAASAEISIGPYAALIYAKA